MGTRRTVEQLIPLFLEAAKFRNSVSPNGEMDNVGAIYSASRTLDILGLLLKYPDLSHSRGLKRMQSAECSIAVCTSKRRDAQIEHVQPLREFTVAAIKAAKPEKPGADRRLRTFVMKHYRLVLLTKSERTQLDRLNRTKMDPKRLENAGIKLCNPSKHRNCKF